MSSLRSLFSPPRAREQQGEGEGEEEVPQSALVQAAREGRVVDVRRFFDSADATAFGKYALWVAAESGHLEVVRVCLDAGVDANVRCGKYGDSPMQRAAESGHEEVVALLIQRGADLDCRNTDGCTPLHDAANGGRTEVVRLLLKSGADYALADYSGASALVAVLRGCPTLSALVLSFASVESICAAADEDPALLHASLLPLQPTLLREAPMSRPLLGADDMRFFSSDLALDPQCAYSDDPYFDDKLFARYSSEAAGKVQGAVYMVRELRLPLQHSGSPLLMRALLEASLFVDDAALFDQSYVQALVLANWEAYGRAHHLVQLAVFVMLLGAVTLSNYTFHDWVEAGPALSAGAWALLAFQALANSLFVCVELTQLTRAAWQGGLLRSLFDLQNAVDWLAYLTLYAGLALRLAAREETPLSASFSAGSTILLWMKVLYFLRPFRSTGPLVRMVRFILAAIAPLISILVAVIFGFSQAFYLLFYENTDLDFADPTQAIANTFFYMLGSIDNSMMRQAPSNPGLAQLLLCLFIFISTILMLNLLVAVMSNAYARIQSAETAEWVRERASIMAEQLHVFGAPVARRHMYCLQRAFDADKQAASEAGAISARLGRLEATQTELQELLDELRNALADRSK